MSLQESHRVLLDLLGIRDAFLIIYIPHNVIEH